MFWDNVAWVYDIFANFINRKANRALCEAVAQLIWPDDALQEPHRNGFFRQYAQARRAKISKSSQYPF